MLRQFLDVKSYVSTVKKLAPQKRGLVDVKFVIES